MSLGRPFGTCWRDVSGCRPVNVEASDFLLDLVEGPMQGRREIGGVQFSGRAFDDDDLAISKPAGGLAWV